MTVTNTNHNMFCPGISMLGSGAIVVTGGSTAEKTSIYTPGQGWLAGPDLNIPRGYQGQTTLSNGKVRTPPSVCTSQLPVCSEAGGLPH
jgi:galactose oxidase